MGNIELFDIYRWILATICTIYVVVCTLKSLAGWLHYFASSRETMVLGRYTMVLLLRLRFRRFGWDLFQIAVLTLIFGFIVWGHFMLGKTA